MPIKSDYITGSLTITQGSVDFTGTDTGWLSAEFREGDVLIDITGATEYMGVIESITGERSGTLTKPWEGPTLTDVPYRLRYQPDGARSTAQARNLIEILGNGNITAFAMLNGAANLLPMFTGPGAMTLITRQALVSGAAYDIQVTNLAGRAAYDGQDQGYAVLVSDVGDGRAAIYSKLSATSGDWSDPAYITGPVGPVVTITEGTTTTLPTGQNATVDIRPVTGGYELDFGIPRGIKGDTGERGTDGTNGIDGIDGIDGAIGPQGEKGDKGDGLTIGASGTLAERDNFDNEPENFAYVDSENGQLYFRETSTPGVWSNPIPFGKGEPGADGSLITTSSGTGNGTAGPYTLDQAPLGLDNVIIASISGVTQYNYTISPSNPPMITFGIVVPNGVSWEVKQAGPLSLGTADAVTPGIIGAASISNDETQQTQIREKIGAGDVIGPSSSENNTVAIFDGLTGKLIKDSGILIEDIGSGDVTGPSSSVSDRIALFDGTTGKVIKDSGITVRDLGGVPLGTPMPILSNTLPAGYLWLEGGSYDPAVYPELNTFMVAAGWPSGTLPDTRNRVLRGLGSLTGLIGTYQEDAFQGHHHASPYATPGFNSPGAGGAFLAFSGPGQTTTAANTPVTDGANGVPRTATETRVKSFTVRWAIKAYGTAINAGTADVIAIEQGLTHAVRDDINQNALAKSSSFKINILRNSLQKWELIEDINFTTVVEYSRLNLTEYRDLRFTGYITPETNGSNIFLQTWQLGGPSWQTSGFQKSAMSTVGGVFASGFGTSDPGYLIGSPNSEAAYGGVTVTMNIFNFNVATKRTRAHSYIEYFSGPGQHTAVTNFYQNSSALGDQHIRFVASAGTISGSIVLEGRR